ncbi:MAG TPA: hypothetical protein PLF71_04155 [bacterium]|nr:MAG: hypothetical protein BWY14_00893 [Parcubacteria group bacterium ADurb.Bin192]HPN15276.1 hypothetical protein [bacterium]
MSDISLLPESIRAKEEQLKKEQASEQPPASESLMHVPKDEFEDVEIIEVEEGEVDQVLSNEPFMTRFLYKAGIWLDEKKDELFKPRAAEPPPKLPPQFFEPSKPQKAGEPAVVQPATSEVVIRPEGKAPIVSPAAQIKKDKARIIPSGTKRRVRIIKKVRKPVHVSLLDEGVVRQLQVNVPKRKFTLAFLTLFFAAVFAASFFLLNQQQASALAAQTSADSELKDLRVKIQELQKKWAVFQDLEPRLISLSDLLDKHVSTLHVFKFLEQNTLSNIHYGGFLMDNEGRVALTVSAPSYEAAAKQLTVFQSSPEVKEVSASAFTAMVNELDNKLTVSFQLIVVFHTQALLFESI